MPRVPEPVRTTSNPRAAADLAAMPAPDDVTQVQMSSFEVILCYLDDRASAAREFGEGIRACDSVRNRWGIAVDAQIELHHQWIDKAVKETKPAQPWTDVELILGHRATAQQLAPSELLEQVLASVDRYAEFAAGERPPRYETLGMGHLGLAANPWRYDVTEADFWATVGLTMWLTHQSAVARQPVLLRELLLTETRGLQAVYAGRSLAPVSNHEARQLLSVVLDSRGVPKEPTNGPQHVAFSLARQWLTDYDLPPSPAQLAHLRERVDSEHARLVAEGWDGPLIEPVRPPTATSADEQAARRRREAELRKRKRK